MKANILYLNTGKDETFEISEMIYTPEKIILFRADGGFTTFYHGDAVEIKIVKE
jgi:hypothetical protein